MFQILAGDLATYCSEAGVANIFYITKIFFTILQVIVPIILIVSASFSLFSLMTGDPDDKKKKKGLINKVAAALIVVLLPFIVDLVMTAIANSGGEKFNYADCWTNAYSTYSKTQQEGTADSDPGDRLREPCLINKDTKKPYDEENCCKEGDKYYRSIGNGGKACSEVK